VHVIVAHTISIQSRNGKTKPVWFVGILTDTQDMPLRPHLCAVRSSSGSLSVLSTSSINEALIKLYTIR